VGLERGVPFDLQRFGWRPWLLNMAQRIRDIFRSLQNRGDCVSESQGSNSHWALTTPFAQIRSSAPKSGPGRTCREQYGSDRLSGNHLYPDGVCPARCKCRDLTCRACIAADCFSWESAYAVRASVRRAHMALDADCESPLLTT